MSARNKYKLVLSKIKIAQCNRKINLKINLFSVDFTLLNTLWKNGVIYGYKKMSGHYIIFLKYNSVGCGLFMNVMISDFKVTKNQIKVLTKIDPNYSYLSLTNKKIAIPCSSIKYGGRILAKIQ
jgi:hypothetical protein